MDRMAQSGPRAGSPSRRLGLAAFPLVGTVLALLFALRFLMGVGPALGGLGMRLLEPHGLLVAMAAPTALLVLTLLVRRADPATGSR